jgi:hypothetical protein
MDAILKDEQAGPASLRLMIAESMLARDKLSAALKCVRLARPLWVLGGCPHCSCGTAAGGTVWLKLRQKLFGASCCC